MLKASLVAPAIHPSALMPRDKPEQKNAELAVNCAVAEIVKYTKRVHPGVLLQIAAASCTVSTTRFPRTSSFSQISCRFNIMWKEVLLSSKTVFRTPTKHVAVKGLTLHTQDM